MPNLFFNSKRAACMLILGMATLNACARAQLLNLPPLPPRENPREKRPKPSKENLEWMWQYSPPPENGREHELIQDPAFRPFLDRYCVAPQSFWGPNPTDPKSPTHKSLADTAYDFLTIPDKVIADDNRYITVTGSVFHRRTSRGFVFVDLNTPHPLVVFAAIDWIRDSKTTDQPEAEYTLWIFPDKPVGTPQAPNSFPPALLLSLTRWMAEPIPGSGIVQKITGAILVDADGQPHQIPVPKAAETPAEGPVLPRRPPS